MHRGRVQLVRVRQCVQDQIGNVPIREGVEDMVAIAPPGDQPFVAEDAQPLRDSREFFVHCRHNLGHAEFAFFEEFENPQPRGIRHRPEQPGGTLQ